MKKYTLEEVKEKAIQCKTRTEFLEKFSGHYMSATRNYDLNEICSHMPINSLKDKAPHNAKWNFETLKLEASKYENRYNFKKNNPSAFNAAKRLDLLNIFYPNKQEFRNAPYSKEEINKEILKYSSRTEMKQKNPYLYRMMNETVSKSELDKLYSHMKRSIQVSSPEHELLEIIKSIYPTAQKLKDRNIKIIGKPHIQGFDIDILISEKNKGIEFDGKYHHSYEYMKKDRRKKKWPDEDVRNYHQIKDDYFLKSRNIEILHIKEVDWLKNKQNCIDKCLEFLK